jgi:hypothetical protein
MRTLFRIGLAMGLAVLMAEQIGRYKPGENLTVFAKKTCRAGRFVIIKGRTASGLVEVEEAGAAALPGTVIGVTQRSADESLPASSVDRTMEVMPLGSGVPRVLASEEIKVGEEVGAAAEGQAKKATEKTLGIALNTAKTGEYVEVLTRT